MIAKYGIVKATMKNGLCFNADIKHKNKSIHFKDSYAILNSKLEEFPKMFNLKDIQKEKFPYKYRVSSYLIITFSVINIIKNKSYKLLICMFYLYNYYILEINTIRIF